MSPPLKIPKLIHMESAIIGGQLVTLAQRGSIMPPDTIATMIMQQLGPANLKRTDVDLAQCGASPSNKAEIRRAYALKMVECLLVRAGDTSLINDEDLERIVRRGWKMAQVMEEEDQVGAQLDAVRQQDT